MGTWMTAPGQSTSAFAAWQIAVPFAIPLPARRQFWRHASGAANSMINMTRTPRGIPRSKNDAMPSFLKLRTSAFICEEKSDHLCADHPAACAGCAIFLSHLRPWSGSHVHDLSSMARTCVFGGGGGMDWYDAAQPMINLMRRGDAVDCRKMRFSGGAIGRVVPGTFKMDPHTHATHLRSLSQLSITAPRYNTTAY